MDTTVSSINSTKALKNSWELGGWEDNKSPNLSSKYLAVKSKVKHSEPELTNSLEFDLYDEQTTDYFSSDWVSNFETIKFGKKMLIYE